MHQHLFWVAVGVLQQGEPTLYSVGLELMEACIKVFTSVSSFRTEVSACLSAIPRLRDSPPACVLVSESS